jgi:hypothetical protein
MMLRMNAIVADDKVVPKLKMAIEDLGFEIIFSSSDDEGRQSLLVTDWGVGSLGKVLRGKKVPQNRYLALWMDRRGFFGGAGHLTVNRYGLTAEVLIGIRMSQKFHKKLIGELGKSTGHERSRLFMQYAIDRDEHMNDKEGVSYRSLIDLSDDDCPMVISGLHELTMIAENFRKPKDFFSINLRRMPAEELQILYKDHPVETNWPFDDEKRNSSAASDRDPIEVFDDCWSFESYGILEDNGYWVGPEASITFETPEDDDGLRYFCVINQDGLSIQDES